MKTPMIVSPQASHCFSSLIGFSRNEYVKNLVSRELLRILEDFHILISKHFDFTLHFSKKSESIFFSLSTSRKRVKDFYFHFSLLELQKPTLAGPCLLNAYLVHRYSLFGQALIIIIHLPLQRRFHNCRFMSMSILISASSSTILRVTSCKGMNVHALLHSDRVLVTNHPKSVLKHWEPFKFYLRYYV